MNLLNLTNIGGLPFDQDVLAFMQNGYHKPFGGVAKLCGDKTILYGVENISGNITDGWIAYNGELLPFVGAVAAARVQITDQIISYFFENNNSYPVETKRTAELVANGGDFDFLDLKRIKTLITAREEIETLKTFIARMKGIITYSETNVYVGDIVNDKFITITIPDQGTADYIVTGSLVGYNNNPDADNDVAWIISNKQPTSFVLAVKDILAPINVQDLKFDFVITQKI